MLRATPSLVQVRLFVLDAAESGTGNGQRAARLALNHTFTTESSGVDVFDAAGPITTLTSSPLAAAAGNESGANGGASATSAADVLSGAKNGEVVVMAYADLQASCFPLAPAPARGAVCIIGQPA